MFKSAINPIITASNRLTSSNALARRWTPAQIQAKRSNISTIVTHGTAGMLKKLAAGGGHRTVVTASTHEKLKHIVPDKTALTSVAPYQRPDLCHFQAEDVVGEWRQKAGITSPATKVKPAPEPGAPRSLRGMWEAFTAKLAAMTETSMGSRTLKSAEDHLATYEKHGPYVFIADGLGEAYAHHAIAVFAVVKAETPQGTRIVAGTVDCNDLASDPHTAASRKKARETGKAHVSELSIEEANENGAHLARIRLLDVESMAIHTMERYKLLAQHDTDFLSGLPAHVPEARFYKEGIDRLAPGTLQELSALFAELYDTDEVEKFGAAAIRTDRGAGRA
ncbi:hypothetical protein D3870_16835 [Noviherbaspirillum cavernae]|uniref:Uncharacterized protein n=1 Tax=Noviherbaspirillum cavernae TaxID=2320862 RepID=A0A418X4T4_9BURK|nr:hypothetical protein [Noviherbaspirillum cavernae]RJG07440.1 hypothetical protein D3870_16835 [Noviherbaspirillum cavernae]